MAKLDLSPKNYEVLQTFIDTNKSETFGLMPVLHKAQEIFGCIPIEVQKFIAQELNISVASIYGVVTFYSRFSIEPVGDYLVSVCLGTACYVKGAQDILDRFSKELGIKTEETSENGAYTLTATRCVGACGLAPVVMINEDVYGKLTPNEVPNILAKYNN
jgi:NADH:ubiquinone oxidoreductase subunit E